MWVQTLTQTHTNAWHTHTQWGWLKPIIVKTKKLMETREKHMFYHLCLLETNLNGFESITEACTSIDFFVQGRKKKTACNLQTSAGNKRWMRRDGCYTFHLTKTVVLVFRRSSSCLSHANLMKKQEVSSSTLHWACYDQNSTADICSVAAPIASKYLKYKCKGWISPKEINSITSSKVESCILFKDPFWWKSFLALLTCANGVFYIMDTFHEQNNQSTPWLRISALELQWANDRLIKTGSDSHTSHT